MNHLANALRTRPISRSANKTRQRDSEMDRSSSGAWLSARLAFVVIKEMSSIAGFGGRIFGEGSLGQTSSFVQVIARAHAGHVRRVPEPAAPATLPDKGRRK